MRNASGHNYWNISFIMDVAMGQIPRSTERISSFYILQNKQQEQTTTKYKISVTYAVDRSEKLLRRHYSAELSQLPRMSSFLSIHTRRIVDTVWWCWTECRECHNCISSCKCPKTCISILWNVCSGHWVWRLMQMLFFCVHPPCNLQ